MSDEQYAEERRRANRARAERGRAMLAHYISESGADEPDALCDLMVDLMRATTMPLWGQQLVRANRQAGAEPYAGEGRIAMSDNEASGLNNYLIHATNDGGDSLDLLVTAHDDVEAVKLWRGYWIGQGWIKRGQAVPVELIALLPGHPARTAFAHEWSDLLLPTREYEP